MRATEMSNAAVVAGVSLAVIAFLWLKKKGVAGVAGDVVGAAADASAGVVLGVGDVVGLPRTDAEMCAKARADGRWMDASFYCPAGEFITSGVKAAGTAVGSALDWSAQKVGYGVGDAIGVPRTNETECERAKREGRTLDASFACPAGDFLEYAWNKWGW